MDSGMIFSRFEFKNFENLNKSANVKIAGTLYPAIRIARTDSPIWLIRNKHLQAGLPHLPRNQCISEVTINNPLARRYRMLRRILFES